MTLFSHSLILFLLSMAVDPHAPVVMEILGTRTGIQDWFLRGGEIMWFYADFLS